MPTADPNGMPFVRYTSECAAQLEKAFKKSFQEAGIQNPPKRPKPPPEPDGTSPRASSSPEEVEDRTPLWMRFFFRLDEEDQRTLRTEPALQVRSFSTNGVECHVTFTTTLSIGQMKKRKQERLTAEAEGAQDQLEERQNQRKAASRAARTRPYVNGKSWAKASALGHWYCKHQEVRLQDGLRGITSPERINAALLRATPAERAQFIAQFGAMVSIDGGVITKLHCSRLALTKSRKETLLKILGTVAGDSGDHEPEASMEDDSESASDSVGDPFAASTWSDWCREASAEETFTIAGIEESDERRHTNHDRFHRADKRLREACGVNGVFEELSRASVRLHGPAAYAAILRAQWDTVQVYANDRQRRRWRFLARSKKRQHLAQTARRTVRFGLNLIQRVIRESGDPLALGPRVLVAFGDGIFPPGGYGHSTATSHRQYAEVIAKSCPEVRISLLLTTGGPGPSPPSPPSPHPCSRATPPCRLSFFLRMNSSLQGTVLAAVMPWQR